MSIIEMVVAAAVLFIALTGLFGLMSATTLMSLKSNQKTTAVNVVNSYIEEIRAMRYYSVGMTAPGSTTGGVAGGLPVAETRTVGGYTVTMTPTVVWVDDPMIAGTEDYKQLTIVASVQKPGESPYTFSVSTFIRPETVSEEDSAATEYLAPTIEFGIGSPVDSTPPAVVSGSAVPVALVAEAQMPGATISLATMSVGTTLLRDAGGVMASWTPDEASVTRTFYWDTLALNEDGNPFSPDGLQTITLEVTDSNQKRVFVTRNVIVDNSPPDAPGIPVTNASTSPPGSVLFTWTGSADGMSPTDHYRVRTRKQLAGGGWTTESIVNTSDSTPQYSFPGEPMSLYLLRVMAEGPGPEYRRSYWSPRYYDPPDDPYTGTFQPPVYFVTRPLLGANAGSADYSNASKIWSFTLSDLTVSKPVFPMSGSATYSLFEIRDGVPTQIASNTTGTFASMTRTVAADKKATTLPLYYEMRVTCTPSTTGVAQTLVSNRIGPVPVSDAKVAFPVGSW